MRIDEEGVGPREGDEKEEEKKNKEEQKRWEENQSVTTTALHCTKDLLTLAPRNMIYVGLS